MREGGRGGRGERREKTYLKVQRGVVGGECGVQLWVYLQRGSETTTTRDGSWGRGRRKMASEKARKMVGKKREPGRKEGRGGETRSEKEGKKTMLVHVISKPTYHLLVQAQQLPVRVCFRLYSLYRTQYWQ